MFPAKRETTLGYFSVMEPFEKGSECFRFARNSGKAGSVRRAGVGGLALKLKPDLLKGSGEAAIISENTSNISVNESHQYHAMLRNSEYSNSSALNRQPWSPTKIAKLPSGDASGVRKHTSSKELAKSSIQDHASEAAHQLL